MSYTVTDIAEMIHYHLVLGADSDVDADANLAQLVRRIHFIAAQPLVREAQWYFCSRCGCSIDAELVDICDIDHFTADGDVLCSDCLDGRG